MHRLRLAAVISVTAMLCVAAYAEAPPPPPSPLLSASYHGTLDGPALIVEVTLRVNRPVDKPTVTRLFSTTWPLVGDPPSGEAGRVLVRDGSYQLWLSRAEKPGQASLSFSFRVSVAARGDGRECLLPVLAAPALAVDLPASLHELRSSPPSPIEREGERLRLYPPAAGTLALRWRATPAPAPVEPAFRVEADTSVSLGQASLAAKSDFTVVVLQGEVRELRLGLAEGAQVRGLTGEAVARWEATGREVAIALRGPERKQVRFALATEIVAAKAGEMAWEPARVAGARLQSGRAYFRAAPGMLLRAVERTGFERVSDGYAPDAAAGQQTLVLVYPRLPASMRLAVEPLPPRITAAVVVLTQLEPGVATQRATIDYSVADAPVRQLQVRVGPGCEVLEAECPGLLDREVRDGVLTVRLREAVREKAQLKLVVQRPVPSFGEAGERKPQSIALPRLEALSVERQTCLAGVAAGEHVELRHRGATEAEQIDVALLPEWVRKLGPGLAYRYYDRPDSVVTIETAPLQAEFDAVARESCVLTDEGWRRDAEWRCRVTRGEVFAWRVRVPEGVVPLEVAALAAAAPHSGTGVPPVSSTGQRPVPPDGENALVLRSWELDEKAGLLKIALGRGVKGEARVRVRFAQRAAGVAALRGAALEGARRYSGELLVEARVPVALRATALKGLTARPGGEGQLAFAQEAPDWQLDLATAPIAPAIDVRSVTVVGVRQGLMAVEAVLHYTIQKAPVNTLAVRLPEGALNSTVRGPDIKSSQLDGQEWTVHLARKVQGDYQLDATYDQLLPGGTGVGGTGVPPVSPTGQRPVPPVIATIETPGATRHEGFLLLARDSDRVELAVEQTQGLRAADPGEVPGFGFQVPGSGIPSQSASRRPIIAAYRFTDKGSLRARIAVLGRADVLQAKALGAVVETVIREDGQAVTQLTYDIRNANRQFLRVELPADAVLLGAYVDDAPVTAASAPGGAAGSRAQLVPLLGKRGADRAVQVAVVYAQHNAPLGDGRRLNLVSPPIDVRTEALSWGVYLPQGYRAQATHGNMTLVYRPPSHRGTALALDMFDDEWRALSDAVRRIGAWIPWSLGEVLMGGGVALLIVLVGILVARRISRPARPKKAKPRRAPRPQKYWTPRRVATAAAILIILAILAGMLLPALPRAREESRRIRSRNNLNQIAKAMATYLNEHGDNRFYPLSLAQLRSVLPDPGVFYDPETGRPVVYLHEGKVTRDDYPPNQPMAFLEGSGGVSVVFFDSHTEFYPYGSDRLAQVLPGRHFAPPSAGKIAAKTGVFAVPEEAEDMIVHHQTQAAMKAHRAEPEGPVTEARPPPPAALEAQKREVADQLAVAERFYSAGRYREAADRFARAAAHARMLAPQIDVGTLSEQAVGGLNRSLHPGKSGAAEQDEELAGLAGGFVGENKDMDYAQRMLLENVRKRRSTAALRLPAPEPAEGERLAADLEPGDDWRKPRVDLDVPAEPGAPPPKPGPGRAKPGEQPPAPGPAPKGLAHRGVETPASRYRYAPVRGGRQKGALPIAFELPSEGALPYIFHRPVTGGALGEIELDCRRLGANRPAHAAVLVGIVGLLALVAGAVVRRRRARARQMKGKGK